MFRGVVPYHRAYLMMHLMSPNPNSPCGQTDTCEDITFPQLNLWAVKMITEFPRQLYITYFYRPPTTLRWSNLFNHVYVCLSICLRGMGSPRLPEAVQTCSPEEGSPWPLTIQGANYTHTPRDWLESGRLVFDWDALLHKSSTPNWRVKAIFYIFSQN